MLVNRDEFFDRQTRLTQYWEGEDSHILGAKDLKMDGMQFGVSKTGRIAVLTNYREPDALGKVSRGQIVLKYLRENQSPEDFLNWLSAHRDDYSGFNIIVGTPDDMWYYSNRDPTNQPIKLISGKIYGLSNHLLDSPWPKVVQGKKLLKSIVDPTVIDSLFSILNDTTTHVPDETVQQTEHGFEKLATIFVPPITLPTNQMYGTRTQNVLLVDDQNNVTLHDRFLDTANNNWINNQFVFKIDQNLETAKDSLTDNQPGNNPHKEKQEFVDKSNSNVVLF